MELHVCSNGSVWKRRGIILLAAFFVLYAVLDISVLQAYCGNETLGIPSYAAQLRMEGKTAALKTGAENAFFIGASQFPSEEQSNDDPGSDDSCFCCCSHTTVAVNSLAPVSKRPASSAASAPNFSDKNLHTDSHPSPHYQPPKFS
jgi:hypothetical protein